MIYGMIKKMNARTPHFVMFVICELFFLVVVTTNCVLKERCENIQEHSRTHGWSWKGFVKKRSKKVKVVFELQLDLFEVVLKSLFLVKTT